MPIDAIEVDFLPVGDGEKSGDAITVRYREGNQTGIQVVDGGTQEETGPELVAHIAQYYDDPISISHVVCSHPDNDHSSGLRALFGPYLVQNLWMNRPWIFAEQLIPYFEGNWTADSLRRRLKDIFPILVELEQLANAQGCAIHEAFAGDVIGPFVVLSPTLHQFLELIPHFDKEGMPTPRYYAPQGVASPGKRALQIQSASRSVRESWSHDNLREDIATSASNETSIVQITQVRDHRILLTADAGPRALERTANLLHAHSLQPLHGIQIPHHGSRRNVTPSILDSLVGPIVSRDSFPDKVAYASAAKADKDHPRKSVTNAFIRRGCRVCTTEGVKLRHSIEMPDRPNWTQAVPEPFYPESEDW